MKEHKLEDKFNPKNFEEEIYKRWEGKEYFKPSEDKTKKPYTIVIPPPNITGKLHMGHALDETLQDILIRYKRMEGYNCLWLPGTDHAAIATEVKIVEKLKQQGIEKKNLTREQFLEKAWEWKKEYGGTILNQLKKLGCSCDWSRERFTMDEGLSNAVKYVFIKLYEKGLIYKGKRMINWCPSCNTSISDAEVEFEEEPTHLWHIRYKVKDEDKYLIVATTRPETMLGDTGVAVHPEDERYKDLVGKKVILPIMNKEIPIVADDFVEKEFGTGAVKLTPAHDPNDYAASQRHNLEIIEVFDENWKMGNLVPEYKGLDIYEARKRIVEKLQEIGALVKIEDYTHNVGKCYRCHHTIEPKISEQWFVKMKPLAEPAIKAVKDGKTRFIPERFDKIYYNWMDNIQDWCISRQLWWGHRIPAYYCTKCNNIMVTESIPHKCEKCGNTEFTQDEDTLDTWFSSALWPFSTLGWPEQTEDLKYFYPTSTLVTGYDIIFFWVSRMIFSGLAYTDKAPFDTVLIHGLVRDAQGRKMSKSLGNGIDPQEIVGKYGADILRLWVASADYHADIRISPEILKQISDNYRKLRNTARYCLSNLYDFNPDSDMVSNDELEELDKYALMKLDEVLEIARNAFEVYDYHTAAHSLHNFCVVEMSNFYFDVLKDRLYTSAPESKTRRAAQTVLYKVLDALTLILTPILAFTADEIWLAMPHDKSRNGESPLFNEIPQPNFIEADSEFIAKWDRIHSVRYDVQKALELARNEKIIGKPLEAKVSLYADGELYDFLKSVEAQLPEIFITSSVTVENGEGEVKGDVEGLSVTVSKADGEKCERCWAFSDTVGQDKNHPTLCAHCAKVMKELSL